MPIRRLARTAVGVVLGACHSSAGAPAQRTALGSPTNESPSNAAKANETSPWQIVPGQTIGALKDMTSEAALHERYGPGAVTRARIELGEGETTPGTVLFSGDSMRMAEIVWSDTLTLSRPARLILRGSRSQWVVGPGVSLGTSLRELERINGRPFTLAGFGWDYAGVVTAWNGGALDTALTGVKLYLDPGPSQYESAPYSQVLGDRDYSSSLPPMQQLDPRVTQIFVDFPE
jgi:hypothetical protein